MFWLTEEAVVFKTHSPSNSYLRDFDVGVGLSCLGFAWVSAERFPLKQLS